MSGPAKVTWFDNQVVELTEQKLGEILTEFGLVAEGESKKELRKGHGVLTGTLRRSVHAAGPDYPFQQDAIASDESSPERGGKEVYPIKTDDGRLTISIGSGMPYALKIHQGWGSFGGYHYIRNGTDRARGNLPAIIGRHMV
jgi:hypothetical protein